MEEHQTQSNVNDLKNQLGIGSSGIAGDPPGTTATNHTSLNDFAADLGRPSERDQFHPCALGTDFKNPSMIPSALTQNDGTFRKVNMKVPNNMYPHGYLVGVGKFSNVLNTH